MARIGGGGGVPLLGEIPILKKVGDKRYKTLRRLGKKVGKLNVLLLRKKRKKKIRKRLTVVAKWRKRLGWEEEEYFD